MKRWGRWRRKWRRRGSSGGGGQRRSRQPAFLDAGHGSAPGQSHDYVNAAWLIRKTAVSTTPSARAFMALRNPRPAPPRPSPSWAWPIPLFRVRARAAVRGPGAGAECAGRGLPGRRAPPTRRCCAHCSLCRKPPPKCRRWVGALAPSPDDILMGANANEAGVAGQGAGSVCCALFRHPRHAAGRTALPGPARPGAVAARHPGFVHRRRRSSHRQRNRQPSRSTPTLSSCRPATPARPAARRSVAARCRAWPMPSSMRGAHAVLASHWEVPSAATTALMTGTFANMSQGSQA